MRKSGDTEDMKLLSILELEELEGEMTIELNSIRQMEDLLIEKQWKEFVRKENELMRENESLRNELKRTICEVEEEVISTCSSYNDEDTMESVDAQSF